MTKNLSDGGAGYYRNSLLALKSEVEKDLRRAMSRYASLERQGHPCLNAQGKLIGLQRRMIEMIKNAECPSLR